jgi:electron transfer flavoprotein beta subunit
VVALTVRKKGIEVLRKGDRGSRQEMAAEFPCTVLFEEGDAPRYPSIGAVTQALTATVETWDLSRLGMAFHETGPTGSRLDLAEFGVPRPDPVRVVTPDASLPAFERIISLLSGGIKAREGRLIQGSADEATETLWQILCDEGLAPTTTP